jgi:hypothetical protein
LRAALASLGRPRSTRSISGCGRSSGSRRTRPGRRRRPRATGGSGDPGGCDERTLARRSEDSRVRFGGVRDGGRDRCRRPECFLERGRHPSSGVGGEPRGTAVARGRSCECVCHPLWCLPRRAWHHTRRALSMLPPHGGDVGAGCRGILGEQRSDRDSVGRVAGVCRRRRTDLSHSRPSRKRVSARTLGCHTALSSAPSGAPGHPAVTTPR